MTYTSSVIILCTLIGFKMCKFGSAFSPRFLLHKQTHKQRQLRTQSTFTTAGNMELSQYITHTSTHTSQIKHRHQTALRVSEMDRTTTTPTTTSSSPPPPSTPRQPSVWKSSIQRPTKPPSRRPGVPARPRKASTGSSRSSGGVSQAWR